MSLTERAAAWLAAWKWVLILAGLLAASVYGNYVQWRHAITVPLRQENAELRDWVAEVRALAAERAKESEHLFADLAAIVERGRTHRIVYRNLVEQLPPMPAECAPGAERVDAVNRFLGPQPATPGETK